MRALAAASVLGWAIATAVAGPSARLQVEPTTAHLGDPLTVRITVDPGEAGTVDVSPLATEWGSVQVLAGTWEPAVSGSKTRVWSGTVAAYEIGSVTVPSLSIPITGGSGPEAATEPVTLTIEGLLKPEDKDKDIADLKPPASIPPDWRPLQRALLGLAALLAISGLAWWLWRRYAAKLAAVAAPVDPFRKMPPHVWVYEELQRLLARRLAEEGNIGLFYDELTRIVKQYLEGRYRIDLLERTTPEVAVGLRSAGAPPEAGTLARALLESGDMVKFARLSAGPEDCRAAVEEAYRLVDMTKPVEIPAADRAPTAAAS